MIAGAKRECALIADTMVLSQVGDALQVQPRVADQPIAFSPTGIAAAALTITPRDSCIAFHGPGKKDIFALAAWANKAHAEHVVI